MAEISRLRSWATWKLLRLGAIGPAVLYALLWHWLNAPIPSLGEGYHTALPCVIAGILFYSWTGVALRSSFNADTGEYRLAPVVSRAGLHFGVTIVAVLAGRVLFTYVFPFDNAMGGVIGAVIGNFIAGTATHMARGRFVHARGMMHLSTPEAARRIQKLPKSDEPRIRYAGYDLPAEVAIGNFIVAGAVGTGKTLMHREVMRSVLPHIQPGSDIRALIYDVKSDLLGQLSRMDLRSEVVVFNPFDKRSTPWNIAADVRTRAQARHFAKALIPHAQGDDKPFFAVAARNIVAGVINKLNRARPLNWTLRDLVLLTASRERLGAVLAGSDLITRYFSPEDTFSNIINTLGNAMCELEPVAALWEKSKTPPISLRQWVQTGNSILVLGGKEDLQESLEPLNRIAFKFIATTFFSEPESPMHARLWFFCDELKTAGRLQDLTVLLNSRSRGVRCVLGFQDMEGLIYAYRSKELAKEIVGRCATVSVLKLSSDDTADWASKRMGECERFEYLETQTKDGKNVGESLTKRDVVMPSEFKALPDISAGEVTGVHLIRGVTGVFKSTAKYRYPERTPHEDFQPRDDADQELDEWTDKDADQLALVKPATVEASTGPDLDTIQRVTF